MLIKQLYQEAGECLTQARAILDEFEGKEMPAEKAEEYDRLMDTYDAKVAEAKRLERAAEAEAFIGEAQNRLPTPAGEGQPENGKGSDAPEVKAAWARYMRVGKNNLTPGERKVLMADDDAAGGFLVAPQQFVAQLIQAVDNQVFVRQFANVMQVANAESLGVPTLETDITDAVWTSELATGTLDTALAFGKRQLSPHPLAKRVKVSNKIVRQASIDADALVRKRLAYKFAIAQESAFMTGDGAQCPLGVFIASALGINTTADTTAASATDIAADDVITCKHELKSQYWPRARWCLHRTILKEIRLLKDGNGQYIWQPGLASDMPSAILDVPYIVSEYAPSASTAGLYVAIIGDWDYYWIADALNVQVQVLNELYAEANETGYIGRLETDGMPVLEEAFRRLIMGT